MTTPVLFSSSLRFSSASQPPVSPTVSKRYSAQLPPTITRLLKAKRSKCPRTQGPEERPKGATFMAQVQPAVHFFKGDRVGSDELVIKQLPLPVKKGQGRDEEHFLSAEIDAAGGTIKGVRIERKITKAEDGELGKTYFAEIQAMKGAHIRELDAARAAARTKWDADNPFPVPPKRGAMGRLFSRGRKKPAVRVESPAERDARFEAAFKPTAEQLAETHKRKLDGLQGEQARDYLQRQFVPVSSWNPSESSPGGVAVAGADSTQASTPEAQAGLRRTLLRVLGAWMKDDIVYLTRESVNPDSHPLGAYEPTGPLWAVLRGRARQKFREAGDKSLLGGPTFYQRLLAVDAAERKARQASDTLRIPPPGSRGIPHVLADAKAASPQMPNFLKTEAEAADTYAAALRAYDERIAELKHAKETGQYERVGAFRTARGLPWPVVRPDLPSTSA